MLSIKVPTLGESIVEATISRWLKKEGDRVSSGETLVELETDKVTVEVPALKAGVITKLYKQEGDVVAVNDVLCDLDENAVADSASGDRSERDRSISSLRPPSPAAPRGTRRTPPPPRPRPLRGSARCRELRPRETPSPALRPPRAASPPRKGSTCRR